MLDVDAVGLDVMDRKLLLAVIEKFGGGPVGVDNLAAAIGEERDTIEDVLEPYLIQQGYLQRTPRGRIAHRARPTATSASRSRNRPARRISGKTRPDDAVIAVQSRIACNTDTRHALSSGPCASTTRTRTRAAWSITPTTSSSSSARAPSGCAPLGFEQTELARDHDVVFVVRSLAIDFAKPARSTTSSTVTVELRSCRAADRCWSQQELRAATRCWSAREVTVACVNTASFRPVRIPSGVAHAMNAALQTTEDLDESVVTHDMSVLSLITNASVLVQLVMAALLLASLLSWTYIFLKLFTFQRARAAGRRVRAGVLERRRSDELYQRAANSRDGAAGAGAHLRGRASASSRSCRKQPGHRTSR